MLAFLGSLDLLFCIFCFSGILASILVIGVKNSVHSVFFLILTFCLSACLLFLLTVDFLSVIFIVVYVGAIAVLFLFVVMMLNIRFSQVNESIVRFAPLMVLLGGTLLSIFSIGLVVNTLDFEEAGLFNILLGDQSGIYLFANTVYTHYWLSFVISGLVLLVAMIGTITLTLHHSVNVRRQAVYEQVGRNVEESITFYYNKYNKG